MSPRVGGTNVSLNDVRILAEAAGVDLSRHLDEQLAGNGRQADGLAARIDALAEKVDALAEGIAPAQDQHPVNSAEARARGLATALDQAQSQWYSTGAGDGA